MSDGPDHPIARRVWDVMRAFGRPVPATEVARAMGVAYPPVLRTMKALERFGWARSRDVPRQGRCSFLGDLAWSGAWLGGWEAMPVCVGNADLGELMHVESYPERLPVLAGVVGADPAYMPRERQREAVAARAAASVPDEPLVPYDSRTAIGATLARIAALDPIGTALMLATDAQLVAEIARRAALAADPLPPPA